MKRRKKPTKRRKRAPRGKPMLPSRAGKRPTGGRPSGLAGTPAPRKPADAPPSALIALEELVAMCAEERIIEAARALARARDLLRDDRPAESVRVCALWRDVLALVRP